MGSTISSRKKRKNLRKVKKVRICIHTTFNNTIVTITCDKGMVLCWGSAGRYGFCGFKKGSAHAAKITSIKTVSLALNDHDIEEADVIIQGAGYGRELSLHGVVQATSEVGSKSVKVLKLKDVTPIKFNGCQSIHVKN